MKKEIVYTPLKEETEEILLARKVLARVCSNIKSKVHEFIPVLNMIEFVPVEEVVEIGTNGEVIFFHAKKILQEAKNRNFTKIERAILHILLHGILGHFEKIYWRYKKLAWIVEDIQVFRYMRLFSEVERKWDEEVEQLVENCIGDELYFKGLKDKNMRNQLQEIRDYFYFEDHRLWDPEYKKYGESEEGEERDFQEQIKEQLDKKRELWEEARKRLGAEEKKDSSSRQEEPPNMTGANLLQGILEKGKQGKEPGTVGLNEGNEAVRRDVREKSYKALLDKITSLCERNQEEEEIDKVLYQYGLELYGDVPLVEPEEINEKYCFHTLVIAVDTSGSCDQWATEFFEEIVALFEDIKKVGKIEHLCYLECDTDIRMQEDYYDLEEFVEFGKTHTFYGGGGTCFTPVFEYADSLVSQGEQVDAVIYITDGYGTFPEYNPKPAYDVYLLLGVENEKDMEELVEEYLPNWAECVEIKKWVDEEGDWL